MMLVAVVAALPMSVAQMVLVALQTTHALSIFFKTIVEGLSLRDRIHNIFQYRSQRCIRLMTVNAEVCVRVSGSGEILRPALDEKANE
jgi:hypothetical protein